MVLHQNFTWLCLFNFTLALAGPIQSFSQAEISAETYDRLAISRMKSFVNSPSGSSARLAICGSR